MLTLGRGKGTLHSPHYSTMDPTCMFRAPYRRLLTPGSPEVDKTRSHEPAEIHRKAAGGRRGPNRDGNFRLSL